MAYIPSASTVTVTAYLTSAGRKYFTAYDQKGNQIRFTTDSNGFVTDNFAITDFSVYDGDANYKSITSLQSGDLPALSGFKTTNGNNTLTSKNIDDTKNQIIL